MDTGFALIITVLAVALVVVPALAWFALRKLSAVDKLHRNSEELHSLENSLSYMIKELQESVQKALLEMDEAAERLNEMIEKADDRLRQLEYYYEYGDELKPLVQPQVEQHTPASAPPQRHALRHKEVHELSRKGWSAAQIAKHTGMSADEVQLIVNLMEISTLGLQSQPQQPRNPMV